VGNRFFIHLEMGQLWWAELISVDVSKLISADGASFLFLWMCLDDIEF
jgi:hypothetical protein